MRYWDGSIASNTQITFIVPPISSLTNQCYNRPYTFHSTNSPPLNHQSLNDPITNSRPHAALNRLENPNAANPVTVTRIPAALSAHGTP
jgi:hypothetical protein